MKIMFCGGGTAGHIYPALAMAEMLGKIYKKPEFVFVGRRGGEENSAIIKAGYRLEEIEIEGLSRSLSLKSIRALIKALKAVKSSRRIILEHSPDVVIGTGGYVCWPTLKAAMGLKIPTAIHESNAYPGLVTRLLASGCDAVMLGFAEAEEYLSRKNNIYILGNPVRNGFGKISKQDARRRLGIPAKAFLCVSFGGSLGSEKMNSAIMGAIPEVTKRHPDYVHVHATGTRYFEAVKNDVEKIESSSPSKIVPYLEDVPTWFAAADLAITRSGAITTAELGAAGLPAILIPSPNVSDNHQLKNALAKEAMGGAGVLCEKELSAEALADKISALIEGPRQIRNMQAALRKEAKGNPEQLFARVMRELLNE